MSAPAAVRGTVVQSSPLAGWGTLARIAFRNERLAIPVTAIVFVLMYVSTAAALTEAYGTQQSRDALAATAGTNQAFLLLLGPLDHTQSVASVMSWRIGLFLVTTLAVLVVLTVVRHSRKDEELGRLELVRSGRVGALAPIAVAIAYGATLSVVTGAAAAATFLAYGGDGMSSLAVGMQYIGVGLAASGIAAVTAQIATTARTANTIGTVVVVAGYALRGGGDVEESLGWLRWLSPVGWAQEIDPFGANRWWPALLCVLLFLVTAGAAVWMQVHRDLGGGLIAPRPGPAGSTRLKGPLSLTFRMHTGAWASWTIAVAAYSALVGFLLTSVDSLAGDSDQMQQLIEQLGGSGALADSMQVVISGFIALAAAAWAVTVATHMRSDETAGRVETTLATRVSRRALFGSAGFVTFLGVAAMLVLSGLCMGVAHTITSGNWGDVGRGVAAFAVQIPAALVVGAVALVLYAWLPRMTGLSWGVLVVVLVVGLFGELLRLPQWVRDISPFTHTPAVPLDSVDPVPLIAMSVVAGVLFAVATVGFGRRDIPS
ncbi:ABC transporter permease [Rhodococcus rhodnii]|uniref:Anibiotic ABC transporter efflux pump n=2 Tax=Rhodococcus rhodnii TaxID=38312 RepID=R7WJT5_9NOCA|nr:anibiotic ABC transporter efflux pump [Rhodococcus rhodnii]EOM74254.1 anibiotic ABC transporter efflux pump [Rhodococcus rhodnii LMG 5362]TXG89595.1 ABC transporter permease [Rhodococcus rhodnii]